MLGNEETTELNSLPNVDPEEMKTVKIILKYGGEFILKCKNFSVTEYGSTITGYDIKGINGNYPLYIRTDQIAAILYMKEGKKCESSTA